MEQKSDEEASEKQNVDSPSKRRSKKRHPGEGVRGKRHSESLSESESNGEAEKSEQAKETPTIPLDKRKLEAKEQMYQTFTAEGASVSEAHSPTKRKRIERHVMASERTEPGKKQLKADEQKPGTSTGVVMPVSPKRSPTLHGTSAAGIAMQESPKRTPTIPGTSTGGAIMQGSPKRSPTIPGTSGAGIAMQGSPKRSPMIPECSAAGAVIQGSPKHSSTLHGTSAAGVAMQGSPKRFPAIPGTSAAGVITQGSPQRSPTKRTYKERQQTFTSDDFVGKRLREESGYQSDSALDLRTDFKKQMPSSTQSPELDCQPTSSDKMGEVLEKRPEEKCAAQSNFPHDPASASSEVTSSDGGEADVSSTSKEGIESTTGEVASSEQGRQVQNVAEGNRSTSPGTSPQHSGGARPKEAAGSSRPVDIVEVSYVRFSPSKSFYGGPIIRRIRPEEAGPSGSGSGGGFKVPPPPPPLEERDKPGSLQNGLDILYSIIVNCHAVVSARQAREQMIKEQEERARKEREQAENFARAKRQAQETTRKLKEKEKRLKAGASQSATAENKVDISPDEAVSGPSTSRCGTTMYIPEENVESVAKRATPPGKEEHESTHPTAGRENIPASHLSMPDENANIMEAGPSRSASEDDNNANKSEPCTVVQSNRERLEDYERPSTSGVASPRSQETPSNLEYLSLQQLVPQINEISLYDSLENVATVDSEKEDDDVDLQNT